MLAGMAIIPDKHLRSTILCLAVFLSISLLMGFFQWNGPEIERPWPDIEQYLNVYKGEAADSPFRFRLWTPTFARFVPTPPDSWLDQARPLEPQRIHFQFMLVNVLGLTLAAYGCWQLGRSLYRSPSVGWITALLFLFSYYPLTTAPLPMAEAWGYAWLAVGLVAIVQRRELLFLAALTLGLLTKETSLLLLPAVWLAPFSRRGRGLSLIPAVAYTLWRLLEPADPSGALYSVESTRVWLDDLFFKGEKFSAHAWRTAIAFHLLWIPAIIGWRRARTEQPIAYRWGWLVPPLLVAPFLLALVPGRLWFFAFPFVLTPAAATIYRWLSPAKA